MVRALDLDSRPLLFQITNLSKSFAHVPLSLHRSLVQFLSNTKCKSLAE